MGFFRTGFIASRAFVKEFGWREGGKMVFHGAWEAVRASLHSETPQSKERLASCMECKMFSKKYSSCGEPTEFYMDAKGTTKSLGCHCFLPLAVKAPSHDCWARFHHLDFGWPEKLRPLIKD
jgi:hypothetical protein